MILDLLRAHLKLWLQSEFQTWIGPSPNDSQLTFLSPWSTWEWWSFRDEIVLALLTFRNLINHIWTGLTVKFLQWEGVYLLTWTFQLILCWSWGLNWTVKVTYSSEIQSRSHISEFLTLILDYFHISEVKRKLLKEAQYYCKRGPGLIILYVNNGQYASNSTFISK